MQDTKEEDNFEPVSVAITEDVESSASSSSPSNRLQVLDASAGTIEILRHVDSDLDHIKEQDDDDDDDDEDEGTTASSSLSSTEVLTAKIRAFVAPLLGYHHDSTVFSLRMSVAVTVASLFLIAFPFNDPWPQASWVYVTACIVAWQNSIDTASVLQKTIQRTAGTMIGAVLGLAFGFVSLECNSRTGQSVFMGCTIALHGFLYPYICDRLGYRSNYAAFLGNFTFGIVLFAFFDKARLDRPWRSGLYRVLNIFIGCMIVAVCSVLVWPISTKDELVKDIKENINNTGESCENVLTKAADAATGKIDLAPITKIFTGHDIDDDGVRAYVQNIDDWKKCRGLFPTLKYDPCFQRLSKDEKNRFRQHMIVRLARCFRIQMNLVMLDAMTRNKISYNGPSEPLEILRRVGRRAKLVLDDTADPAKREVATKALLEQDLVRLRYHLARMTEATHHESTVDIKLLRHMLSNPTAGLPLSAIDRKGEQSILFFSLVEHLILRVARLYYFCLEYDDSDDKPINCCHC